MDSIRVSNGTKKIEVNDDGEYITLPLGSNKFIRDFYLLFDDYQKQYDEAKLTEKDIPGSIRSLVDLEKTMADKLDGLFGEGTCVKVFGNDTPSTDYVVEFLYELLPFIEGENKKRKERLNKYNAGRTGSV